MSSSTGWPGEDLLQQWMWWPETFLGASYSSAPEDDDWRDGGDIFINN